MKDRILSMLGLSRKAGRITIGYDPTTEEIIKGNVFLLILAEDLSPKTAARIKKTADFDGVPVMETDLTMDEIGFAIGKRSGILGLTDLGIAGKVKSLLEESK